MLPADESSHIEGAPHRRAPAPCLSFHPQIEKHWAGGLKREKRLIEAHPSLFLWKQASPHLSSVLFWVDTLCPDPALPPPSGVQDQPCSPLSAFTLLSHFSEGSEGRNESEAGHRVLSNPNKKITKQQHESESKAVRNIL